MDLESIAEQMLLENTFSSVKTTTIWLLAFIFCLFPYQFFFMSTDTFNKATEMRRDGDGDGGAETFGLVCVC